MITQFEWLSRAIRQEAKPGYLAALGFTLKQVGRPDDALAVFDKAVKLKPDDPELCKQLGGALAATRNFATVVAVCDWRSLQRSQPSPPRAADGLTSVL